MAISGGTFRPDDPDRSEPLPELCPETSASWEYSTDPSGGPAPKNGRKIGTDSSPFAVKERKESQTDKASAAGARSAKIHARVAI